MTIGPIGGASGPGRVDPPRRPAPPAGPSGPDPKDRVEISDEARLLAEIQAQPGVRADRVEALRREIESGKFETPERLKGAVDRFLDENG